MIAKYLFFMFAGFASGSILYSYHIPKLIKDVNIVECSSDHNPGSTNAMKYAGLPIGLICMFLDIVKGFIPIVFALLYIDRLNILFALVMVSPVLGHSLAIFYRGIKGGKSIAVSFGVLLGLFTESIVVLILAFWYILFSLLAIHPDERKTIYSFTAFGICVLLSTLYTKDFSIAAGCFLIAAIVINKNRIKRLVFDHAYLQKIFF